MIRFVLLVIIMSIGVAGIGNLTQYLPEPLLFCLSFIFIVYLLFQIIQAAVVSGINESLGNLRDLKEDIYDIKNNIEAIRYNKRNRRDVENEDGSDDE